MDTNHENAELLPEWQVTSADDAEWIAALEAQRYAQFAELAEL